MKPKIIIIKQVRYYSMEELIRKMLRDLRVQVEEKVPEEGDFPMVYERYENPDKRLNISHLLLKVSPVKLEGRERKRFLDFVIFNYPNPYCSERCVGAGTKQEILDRLVQEELFQKIMNIIPEMEHSLEGA